MARILVAASLLTLFASVPAHADATDEITREAASAGVDPTDLSGALSSEHEAGHDIDAHGYLCAVGEGTGCPVLIKPEPPPLSGRLACIAWQESRNNPNATNPKSKAAGLFQFLHSTWLTTPQGKAGMSPYDPTAATAAAEWMIRQGRVREWSVVTAGLC